MTNIVPLALVVAASLAKEAVEDAKRAANDRRVNARPAAVLGASGWGPAKWRDVRVGDLIRVR